MKLWESLRGARGLEWILLLICVALALMLFLRGGGDEAAGTSLEARLQTALSAVEGAGKVRVLIHEGENCIQGVLIVAQGADDLKVRFNLQQAAHSILGVELAQIEVLKMKAGE